MNPIVSLAISKCDHVMRAVSCIYYRQNVPLNAKKGGVQLAFVKESHPIYSSNYNVMHTVRPVENGGKSNINLPTNSQENIDEKPQRSMQ